MNPESIPKLRVIDSGGSRSAAAPADAASAAPAAPAAPKPRVPWLLVLLFVAGAVAGGIAMALLGGRA